MSDRTASRTRQTPVAETPDAIRNVALVGCSATGKTTLAESLAFASGAIGRAGRVVDGTTVSDYEEIEQQHRRSVQLAVLPLEWKGIKINLIDTPGHPDFDADLRAGLHAADARSSSSRPPTPSLPRRAHCGANVTKRRFHARSS